MSHDLTSGDGLTNTIKKKKKTRVMDFTLLWYVTLTIEYRNTKL